MGQANLGQVNIQNLCQEGNLCSNVAEKYLAVLEHLNSKKIFLGKFVIGNCTTL